MMNPVAVLVSGAYSCMWPPAEHLSASALPTKDQSGLREVGL